MLSFNFLRKAVIGAMSLFSLSLSSAHLAQAQAYADLYWDTIINGNSGDFNMGGGVNFKCRRGQGDLTVTVAAGGSPNQTTIEFRNGGTYYRSTARKNAAGTYTFTVSGNRTSTMYRLLTAFPNVNIDVAAAGPIFVETGADEGSEGPIIMREFCSPGGSGKTLTSQSAGKAVSCKSAANLRSKKTLGSITVKMTNRTLAQRVIFWIDPRGQKQMIARLAPGQSLNQQTKPGHVWMITDAKGNCRTVLVAQSNGEFIIQQ